MTTRRTTPRRPILLVAAALVAVLAAGCSDGSDDAGRAGTMSGDPMQAEAPTAADEAAPADALMDRSAGGADSDKRGRDGSGRPGSEPGDVQPAVISTGTVSLAAADVADARAEVQRIADHAGGAVTQEETTTDDDGALSTARMVLRVPSAEFSATTDALEEVGTLERSTTGSEDVTTEVLDVAARIRAQEKSVRRVEALLARADTLSEIITIEADLAERQADLDSLKSRQKWLEDQTSLSTITVHLHRTGDDETDDEDGADGFLGGLETGWDSFVAGLAVAATAVGFLLPWVLALAVLGAPLLLWWRSRRRHRQLAPAAGPTAGPAAGP
ncbi:DUF4349 domain-containing protein [Nocardioides sp. SYSU DS0651]|uniref:DUF4349 domain-containing protein n=1 Tax=Nocardioides sp. SYSU DS0651 TaxID=3415955 RepID=UPI003F4BEB0F